MSFILALAVAIGADSQVEGTRDQIKERSTVSSRPFELWADFKASPAIGEDIEVSADDDRVDDSDYEAALRLKRTVKSLRQLPAEARFGVTGKPNTFDDEDAESTLFFEAQLGDSFFRPGQLANLRFEDADAVDRKAIRPYLRYRVSRNYKGLITDYSRTDQAFTAGIRYRYNPFGRVVWTGEEDGEPQKPIDVRGTWFEIRGELTRVSSTDEKQRNWNPRIQFDVTSSPFWNLTRFVIRGTGEVTFFDNLLDPQGDRVVDRRVRLTAGFDVSEPIKDLLDLKRSKLTTELLGRWQRRWSNGANRDHNRAYFVPTLTLAVPID